jgi:hypothetical protein
VFAERESSDGKEHDKEGTSMRIFALVAAVGLALLTLGRGSVEASEPIGPFCLVIDTFRDSFEMFAAPSGGSNFLLSGRNRSSGGPLIGSGYVAEGSFVFYLLSPLPSAPGFVFRGTIDLATQTGTGQCFLVDAATTVCGNGDTLRYALVPCD